jgi:hypothetical protein
MAAPNFSLSVSPFQEELTVTSGKLISHCILSLHLCCIYNALINLTAVALGTKRGFAKENCSPGKVGKGQARERPAMALLGPLHRCLASLGLGHRAELVAGRRLLHCTPPHPASLPVLDEGTSAFTDLTCPASWYPIARALQRKVIAHLGPTNSGKTFAALESLKQASRNS